jgi:hypothetical protein
MVCSRPAPSVLTQELQHFRHQLDPQRPCFWKTRKSAEYHRADIIIGCALIGVVAVLMDRLLLAPLERRTIERWPGGVDARGEIDMRARRGGPRPRAAAASSSVSRCWPPSWKGQQLFGMITSGGRLDPALRDATAPVDVVVLLPFRPERFHKRAPCAIRRLQRPRPCRQPHPPAARLAGAPATPGQPRLGRAWRSGEGS